ncbi:MAG: NmrA family NAD(P)-binding protein, partial [Acidobacteria bacterium]|nr:NmrA family NAD(P)-binding protein [Acidobacteriota bacterium]
MKKVLVAGATGQLGTAVVTELKRRGYWVRACGRNGQKLQALKQQAGA